MKKTILFLSIITLFVSCGETPKQAETKDAAETTATEKPTLSLANFDTEAALWVNKEIEVIGIVDHVCKHGGKKLFLVDDFGDVHIDGEKRFDDELIGSEVIISGLVKEFRVDESYCLQQEEDFIKKHSEGADSDDVYAQKMEHINSYRDSMATTGVDHLSFYSIEYISHVVK